MSNKFLGKYRIQSTRKPNWDYSSSGWYFVTICTYHRIEWFGEIINKEMILSQCGQTIDKWWRKLPTKFEHIEINEYIIMPNHFHGIITINPVETDPRVRLKTGRDAHMGASLHDVVGWFKTMTTNEYIQNVKNKNWKPFHKHIWQTRYHDRIIRDEFEYSAKVEYILNNPARWDEDRNNPKNIKSDIITTESN